MDIGTRHLSRQLTVSLGRAAGLSEKVNASEAIRPLVGEFTCAKIIALAE
jgi:hypothetical protein